MRMTVLLIASYLVGSIPVGVITGQRLRGIDVRKYGSGNIGFSNVLRVLGPLPAAIVLVGDVLKGTLPVMVGKVLLDEWDMPAPDLWLLSVALAPILGHSFSIFLGLRGGRAVGTTCGALLGMCWPAALIGTGVWAVVIGATRYVSVGSIVGVSSVPVYMALRGLRWEWVGFWTLIAALVIARHIPNLRRLLEGTEAKIGHRAEVGGEGAPE
jgi:glycerol-3-phosphate acyltransferase PlsY